MESLYSVKLEKLIQEFRLEVLRGGAGCEDASIRVESMNRPSLQLVGFFDYFDTKRLQVISHVETTYLEGLTSEERRESFELLLPQDIPTLITSRETEPFPECMKMAEKYDRTILHSPDTTGILMSSVVTALKSHLAPRITRHGTLAEVYGEDVLLLGESGAGKSGTAIGLVKHGYRLIADDAVGIKRNVTDRPVGTASELVRHHIELRGIDVIDMCRLFDTSAVRDKAEVDMVINLEQWKNEIMYDRLGLEDLYTTILDVQAPSLAVPVRPGRNPAAIIEMAAMNNRYKEVGYNAAVEFTRQISQHFDQAMSAQLNGN